ncbi:MAG: tetratricopeptide repeat protein [Deltaproteobacteria bacterium]|nr:tetratricopeptide repeat protein [Deltaproteobacteria bacterium]
MFRRIVVAGILVLAVLAILLPFPCFAGKEEGERIYTSARELLSAGDAAGAIRLFEKAIAEYPEHVEARYHLGVLYSGNINTYGKAEETFFEIPDFAMRAGSAVRDDLFFRTGLALGNLYIKSGRHVMAIQLIRNLIASAPPNAPLDRAFNALGLSYYYDRLYDDAIFELRRAIKFNPNNVDARFNLKTIRARLEHFQAAKIYSRMGERTEAIAEYRRAIEIDPRFTEARQRLGVELLLVGKHAEGLKELRRADSISTGYRRAYEIWYAEGLALQSLGRGDDALHQFNRVIESRPNFAAAHNEIGKIRLERKEYDAAIDCFARAIGLDPKTEYARNLVLSISRKGTLESSTAPARQE